jgi:hypothetical protein
MTVAEALAAVRRVGTVERAAGTLKLVVPKAALPELGAEVATLREHKAEALAILADPDPAELARASAVLNRAGVRIMALEGGTTIGLWSRQGGARNQGGSSVPQDGRATSALPRWRRHPDSVQSAAGGRGTVPMNVLAENGTGTRRSPGWSGTGCWPKFREVRNETESSTVPPVFRRGAAVGVAELPQVSARGGTVRYLRRPWRDHARAPAVGGRHLLPWLLPLLRRRG